MAIKITLTNKEIILDKQQEIVFGKLLGVKKLFEQEEKNKTKTLWQRILKFFNKEKNIEPKSIYIYGEVGRGKSALMDNFYEQLEISGKARFHFNDFMQQVHCNLRLIRQQGQKNKDLIYQVISSIVENIRVLCFDEFQVEDCADALLLKKAFSCLFKKNVIVVFTSNRHPLELYQNGLQRDSFLEFVHEVLLPRSEVVSLENNLDYRSFSRDSIDEYFFYPDNNKNKRKFTELICQKVGNKSLSTKIISFLGREFIAHKATNDVAVFKFAELFEDNLGMADYGKICQTFKTIFVEDIKQITPDNSEQAKRFILFIDEVYENKVKIFCLSKVSMKSIYPKGKSSFIFKRTISRMTELGDMVFKN